MRRPSRRPLRVARQGRLGRPLAAARLDRVAADLQRPVGEAAQPVGLVQLFGDALGVVLGHVLAEPRDEGAADRPMVFGEALELHPAVAGVVGAQPLGGAPQRRRDRRFDRRALGGEALADPTRRGLLAGQRVEPVEVVDEPAEGGGPPAGAARPVRQRDEGVARGHDFFVGLGGERAEPFLFRLARQPDGERRRHPVEQRRQRVERRRPTAPQPVGRAGRPDEEDRDQREERGEAPPREAVGDFARVRFDHRRDHEGEDQDQRGGGDVAVDHPGEEDAEADQRHHHDGQPGVVAAERAERDRQRSRRATVAR